jgi:multidrug efflux pump subunit AcrA (membrane-fusion protein)
MPGDCTDRLSGQWYLPSVPPGSRRLYWLLLAGFSIVVILLPLITVDISVTVSGAVRPEQERAELKLLTAAVIDSVFYREGDSVPRDSLIMQLYDVSVRAEE